MQHLIGRRSRLLVVVCLACVGCGGGVEFTEDGGTGGTRCEPVMADVEDTCTGFCVRAVGDCGAFVTDEASCREGCQANLNEEYGCSEECGGAVEAVFQCVADLDDCQDVYDWRDRVPADAYPCKPAVDNVGMNCPF